MDPEPCNALMIIPESERGFPLVIRQRSKHQAKHHSARATEDCLKPGRLHRAFVIADGKAQRTAVEKDYQDLAWTDTSTFLLLCPGEPGLCMGEPGTPMNAHSPKALLY